MTGTSLPTFCGDNTNQQSRNTSKTSLFKAATDFSVKGEISQGCLGHGWIHGKTVKRRERHTTISLLRVSKSFQEIYKIRAAYDEHLKGKGERGSASPHAALQQQLLIVLSGKHGALSAPSLPPSSRHRGSSAICRIWVLFLLPFPLSLPILPLTTTEGKTEENRAIKEFEASLPATLNAGT